jgi:DNA-binding CsgD family transcriptional regulator
MTARLPKSSRQGVEPEAVLDLFAQSETPALATDSHGHVVSWNCAAERAFGRTSNQVLGRRCYEVMGGRDVFGNPFCYENCAVLSMARKGESVRCFEMTVVSAPRPAQVSVTVVHVPGSSPEKVTLVHLMQPIDEQGRLARALEQLGAREQAPAAAQPAVCGAVALAKAPPLTEREREVMGLVAAGLQNKEVAQKLGISPATVRNHVHNILEKLEVHSKLEAVSLAFRQGQGDRLTMPGRPERDLDPVQRTSSDLRSRWRLPRRAQSSPGRRSAT